ncbi:MAG TPA: hypothetical protein VIV11_43320 [Kofleriaceae bacterium]
MRRFLLIPLFVVAAVEPARASTCSLGPFARPAFDPPADCTIVFYRNFGVAVDPPRAIVHRDNVAVDVTATSTQVRMQDLDMGVYTVDCNGNVVSESHHMEPFDVFELTLTDVQPSEVLYVGGMFLGTVQAAGGACNTDDVPVGVCSGMYDWSQCEQEEQDEEPPGDEVNPPEIDDAVGCNATNGVSSGLFGIVLLAVAGRRRRRATR